jgi:hypothetical protein
MNGLVCQVRERIKKIKEPKTSKQQKYFYTSLTEIPSNKILNICIYRIPDRNFEFSLPKLGTALNKENSKYKILVSCGEINIGFLKENS